MKEYVGDASLHRLPGVDILTEASQTYINIKVDSHTVVLSKAKLFCAKAS